MENLFTQEELQVMAKFMERVELKGQEAVAWVTIMQKIQMGFQALQAEQAPKAPVAQPEPKKAE